MARSGAGPVESIQGFEASVKENRVRELAPTAVVSALRKPKLDQQGIMTRAKACLMGE